MTVEFDPSEPLARLPGETLKANAALRDYYLMGSGRSIRKLFDSYLGRMASGETAPTTQIKRLFMWSIRHAWQARLEAQVALENAQDLAKWAERRLSIRESDYTQGQSLRDLAARILIEGPNFIKTRRRLVKGEPALVDQAGNVIRPGTPDREVVTMALDGALAVKAAQAGSALARLAAGMVQNQAGLDLTGSVTLESKSTLDLKNFDNDDLSALLEQSARLLMALSSGVGPGPNPGAPEASDLEGPEPGQADA